VKDFIRSLSSEEQRTFGDYFVEALQDSKTYGENTPREALQEAIEKLLMDCLPSYESEGFYDYICNTARQVIEGVYESIDEIRKEFDELIREANRDNDREVRV
jgi:hypothetical protein